ncbi:MAG: hypothetical protein WCQ67_02335 [Treponema sp.]
MEKISFSLQTSFSRKKSFSLKKIVSIVALIILPQVFLYASDWTLGATKFSFSQNESHSSSEEDAASILPQLILEQIVSTSSRITTNREMLNRALDDLLTKRLSLFLQLSNEVKVRDSLVIQEDDKNNLKKKIAEEEKKIDDIEKQIDENLKLVEKAKRETLEKIKKEEKPSLESEKELKEENREDKKLSFQSIQSLFNKKENVVAPPSSEKIVLYKNDSSSLFSVPETALISGVKSREFDKAVTSAKINGLLTGTITIYGDYIAVTVELLIFPGAISNGVVTEVGTLSDLVEIAQNIALYFSPKIFNSMPINLFFDIVPEDAALNAKVTIDGIVYSKVPQKAIIQSGIHTIEIESKGYNTQTVSWNFSDVPSFLIHAAFTEEKNGVLSLSLKEPLVGAFYANGKYSGESGVGKISTSIEINGQPVIGQILTDKKSVKKVRKEVKDENGKIKYEETEEEGSYIGSFFYIPEFLSNPNESLIIKAKPVDNATVVNNRRIWMYRGYSALMVSLPATFFTIGKSKALTNGYNSGAITDISQIATWQNASYISIGVSCAAGAFFIFELAKYLKAADAVIPVTARQAKNSEIEKSLEKSKALEIQEDEKQNDTVNTEDSSVTTTETSTDQTSTESIINKINE